MDILSLLKFRIYIWFCLVISTYSLSTSPSFNSYTYSDDGSVPQSATSPGLSNVHAFRVDSGWSEVENGLLYIYAGEPNTVRLIGREFGTRQLSLAFTTHAASKGTPCDDLRSSEIFTSKEVQDNSALFEFNLPYSAQSHYFCIREENRTAGGRSQFVHLGQDLWMTVGLKIKPIKSYFLPLWLQIVTVMILLTFSGLFSGLNLGLMSLDKTELNIMMASGTAKEKRYAKTIYPLRKRGNFLLCTILLGNVLVNNCLTLLLDDLSGSGVYAIIGATLAIVVFGEIMPQAICSRYGLAVGARTIWFTKFFMLITFPLSFPISIILDSILGEEMGYVYNRDRLRELLKQKEKDIGLVTDEVNIITGALELSKKTVGHIMTKIENVFMIEYNSVLDFETITKIMDSGYTRIPVYEKERSNVVALLNTKDLAFVDTDDKIPLSNVTKFYNHPLLFVFEDVKLDVILQDFKKGGSHMAMVQHVVSDGPGDPFYQVVGLVTLEDVIEEIIQSEIYDEFDTVTDNINRQPRAIRQKDYSVFNVPTNANVPRLTPQLQLASFQFMSGTLAPFKPPHMSERILYKLMTQNVVVEYKIRADQPHFLYQHGKPSDNFVLIVQGRVLVQSGMENLTYEAGSFSYFGLQALLVKSVGKAHSTTTVAPDQAKGSPDNEPSQKDGHQQSTSPPKSPKSEKVHPPPSSPPRGEKIPQPSSPKSVKLRQPTSPTKGEKVKPGSADSNLVPATGPFVPDYTVRALTNLQYLKISRDQYLIAWRASQLENELQKDNQETPEDAFDKEWKKTNQVFVDNVPMAARGSKRQSVGQVSSPSYGTASGSQIAPGPSFFQQIRRTLGFSTYSQTDSWVNVPKPESPTSKSKSNVKGTEGKPATKRGVRFSQTEVKVFSPSADDMSIATGSTVEAKSPTDATKSKTPTDVAKPKKSLTEKDKPPKTDGTSKTRDKSKKSDKKDNNKSANSIADNNFANSNSDEHLDDDEDDDGSKMESEALLQDVDLIEVKIVKP